SDSLEFKPFRPFTLYALFGLTVGLDHTAPDSSSRPVDIDPWPDRRHRSSLVGRSGFVGGVVGISGGTRTLVSAQSRQRSNQATRNSPAKPVIRRSRQLGVFRLGLLEDRDIGVGVFPEIEEILVGGHCLGLISCQRERSA